MAPTPIAPKSGTKTLSTAANLANLLPTGTVLAFQALVPSFSNNGTCLASHKYLTFCAIICCSISCFLTSFTDSFVANGKLYYGIATINGLYIFNKDEKHDDDDDNDKAGEDVEANEEKEGTKFSGEDLEGYKFSLIDFVHAFASLMVFLVFSTSSSDVQNCFFPHAGPNGTALMKNLPLGVGALVSFLFMIFPTRRRGIGYADMAPRPCPPQASPTPTHI